MIVAYVKHYANMFRTPLFRKGDTNLFSIENMTERLVSIEYIHTFKQSELIHNILDLVKDSFHRVHTHF